MRKHCYTVSAIHIVSHTVTLEIPTSDDQADSQPQRPRHFADPFYIMCSSIVAYQGTEINHRANTIDGGSS